MSDLQELSRRNTDRVITESSPGEADTAPGSPLELVRVQVDVRLGDEEQLAEARAAPRGREEAESLASERDNPQ
jgi:hypothetical protein